MKILEYLGFNRKNRNLQGEQIGVLAQTLYKVGKRANNEDYFFPITPKDDAVFVVCDGVGGTAKGEIASKIVAETIYGFLTVCNGTQPDLHMQEAVDKAVEALHAHAKAEPMSSGLGTTAVIVWLYQGCAYLGHVGDSRIYFYRNEQKLYESRDHSMVNDLIAAGVISEERAKTHPKRNVITRAIKGNVDGHDPTEKTVRVTVEKIPEIFEGDQILLCSDGIIESFDSVAIDNLVFLNDQTIADKIKTIEEKCDLNSRDNHTLTWLKIYHKDK